MHPTHIDLSLDQRQKAITLLNARLADAVDLGLQTKMAHWNVRGPHFFSLHLLFDKVSDQVREASDQIAERIGQLGGIAQGSLQDVAKATSLGQFTTEISKGSDIVKSLVQGLSTFTNNCRKDIDNADELGDKVTADLFTRITGETDQNLWFVESHLE